MNEAEAARIIEVNVVAEALATVLSQAFARQ